MTDALFERYNGEQERNEAMIEARNARILRRVDLKSRTWRKPAPDTPASMFWPLAMAVLAGALVATVAIEAWQGPMREFQRLEIVQ